jgi:hypothetical protein
MINHWQNPRVEVDGGFVSFKLEGFPNRTTEIEFEFGLIRLKYEHC